MRTNIVIDDKLMKDTLRATGQVTAASRLGQETIQLQGSVTMQRQDPHTDAGVAVVDTEIWASKLLVDGVPSQTWSLAIANGLRTFRGLPHRLERIREVGGVVWINDSKATNVASTAVALRAMDRPYVAILGGRHKGEPYTQLGSLVRNKVKVTARDQQ